MNRPRWHKVIADLWSHPSRSLLVMASILVGLFAIGVIASLYVLIDRDMRDGYAAIHPANIFISTSLYDKQLLDHLENIPGVQQAQGARLAVLRLQSGPDQWIAIQLVAVPDLEEMQINRVQPLEGEWPPADRQIVIEQSKLPRTHARLNDLVTLELPSGDTRQLPLVGVVQDESLGAGTGGTGGFFNASPRGYVTQKTLEWLEQPLPKRLNNVYLVVSGDTTDTAFIEGVSTRVTADLENDGISVFGSSVRGSTSHPNEDLVKAMTGVLLVLGLLVVFLGGFLITNTLQALLEQQVQQVGIMKSVGARRVQIVFIYMVLILVYGILAFVLSVPLAVQGSGRLLNFLAGQLNFTSGGGRLVPAVVALQGILALLVPQVAGFLPIWKGTGISVQEALSGIHQDEGRPARRAGKSRARLRRFSRPVRIAFQNVFRRPGRLALTLITLTSGGAIFIGTFGVQVSMQRYIDQIGRYFLADVNVTLERPYRIEKIQRLLEEMPNVRYTEAWASARSQVLLADGTVGEDVQLLGPPANSPLVVPVLITGRWIQPGDHNAIVLNELFLSRYPDMKVGDTLRLQVNGKETGWVVVGFFRFAGKVTGYLAYTDYTYLTEVIGQVQQALLYRVVMADPNPTPEKQDELAQVIEITLRQDGIPITEVSPGSSLIDRASGGFGILTSFLLFLAGLIALVGSIGLAGTMSMNVMERTREIGILRAVGATNRVLMKMVIIEGMLIGLISWVLASFLSIPIGKLISDSITRSVFGAPSQPGYPPVGFLLWLGAVILLSVLASVMPARNAARLTIREVLSYE